MSDEDDLDEFGIAGNARTHASTLPPPVGLEAQVDADGWSEVLGSPVPPGKQGTNPADILGNLANMSKSPAFQAALAKKIAARAPIVQKISRAKAQLLTVDFGPVILQPGQVMVLSQRMQRLFRGEKFANRGEEDDLFVHNVYVGNRRQFNRYKHPFPARELWAHPLSDGPYMETCQPGMDIHFEIGNHGAIQRKFGMTLTGRGTP